jgi:hypothetical protein
MPHDAPPPTNVIHRFAHFIEALKRAMAEGVGRSDDRAGPLALVLWHYLSRMLRRLAALHARFAAGTLAAPPRRSAGRPVADRPASLRRPPRRPRGPVLARYHTRCLKFAPVRVRG